MECMGGLKSLQQNMRTKVRKRKYTALRDASETLRCPSSRDKQHLWQSKGTR